jgi:hypothetical protein
MTEDEALAFDLALEALEETLKTLDDANAIPGGPIADTIWYSPYETLFDYLEVRIAAIKQARSVPYVASPRVQEPIALKPCWYESKEKTMCRKCGQVHAEAIPPAAQTATVLQQAYRTSDAYTVGFKDGQAAQRQWQSLTDEEITALKRNGERYISSQDFARAIEDKLKEKNT